VVEVTDEEIIEIEEVDIEEVTVEEEPIAEEKPELTHLTCHGCGRTIDTELKPKEFVCNLCGAVNVVKYVEEGGLTAASCIPPTGFEWKEPSGVLEGPSGKIFVSAQGTYMTKKEWMEAYGVDPEINLTWMRNMGKTGKEGYANMSTMADRKGKKGIQKVDPI